MVKGGADINLDSLLHYREKEERDKTDKFQKRKPELRLAERLNSQELETEESKLNGRLAATDIGG